MAKVCILGGGSWGIGLSVVLHKNGHEVTVWSAVPAEIQMLQEKHEHKMLPGVKLSEEMIFTTDDKSAIDKLIEKSPPVFITCILRCTSMNKRPVWYSPRPVLLCRSFQY